MIRTPASIQGKARRPTRSLCDQQKRAVYDQRSAMPGLSKAYRGGGFSAGECLRRYLSGEMFGDIFSGGQRLAAARSFAAPICATNSSWSWRRRYSASRPRSVFRPWANVKPAREAARRRVPRQKPATPATVRARCVSSSPSSPSSSPARAAKAAQDHQQSLRYLLRPRPRSPGENPYRSKVPGRGRYRRLVAA